MKQLTFHYQLKAVYDPPVRHHAFSVRFLPDDTSRQRVEQLAVRVQDGAPYLNTRDSFGSRRIYGTIEEAHESFDVEISGKVQTGLDIAEEYTSDPYHYALFKVQSALTEPGDGIRRLHDTFSFSDADGPYDRSLAILSRLYESFRYCPGLTKPHERAETALLSGGGVCQDFAHLMLSLLRMEQIPARYVVGMMTGEGASHAWVEVLCRGCWYGFDPTNGKLVDDDYIRVSCGRDSTDCNVIRGSFLGMTKQEQWEKVTVEEQ